MPVRTTGKIKPRQIARFAGGLNVVVSLLVMVSWYAHWRKVLQLIPETAPMQFNTAVCFLICGLSLFFLTTRWIKFAPFLGGLVALLALLTLSQYVAGWDLHLDLLFFSPFFEAATTYPGRMSPLAAVCFMMMGSGIVLLGKNQQRTRLLEAAGLLACIVGIIAVVALVGFAFGISSAYGWGAYSSLALNTSILFLALSLGLLVLVWEQVRQTDSNFIHWLPVTGSVTLMAMVAVVAIGDVSKLKTATYWRKHTVKTILAAHTFENNLIDVQRGMRGYITSGDKNSLASFRQAVELEHNSMEELRALTVDNPEQQKKLRELDAEIGNLLALDNRLIKLYDQKGAKAVFSVEIDQEMRAGFGRTYDSLKRFSVAEQELLDLRDVSEAADIRKTEHLLVAGCALAVGLLLLANFMATNELGKRKRAEAGLARQALELRRSNTELEQFAYVASHDMREPLRAVTGFAQILQSQCAAKLVEDELQILSRIVAGAKRMSDIIDDLLTISRVSSQRKPFEKVKLDHPLQVALENLAVAIKERGVVVRYEALPTLVMDGSQVALLFQNLIGNAVKFCSNRTPEIQVAAKREADGYWIISVRDNGIGIEPKYFDKIFGIFQRLHTRDVYPGTGIGLAICKKVVERHGGRIWLESEPGIGTTFYFTLSERQDNPNI